MDEKVIELKYNRIDFEEIYFSNGNDKTFLNKEIRKERYTFIVTCSLFLVTLPYYFFINNNLGILIFMGILQSITFLNWYKKTTPLIQWKNDVKIYLDNLDKIKLNRITLTDNSFSFIQDKNVNVSAWTEFNCVIFDENYISFKSSNTTYLIPKKSMLLDEFIFLKKILSEKINK